MTATDELRKLLDERGVEWSDVSDDDIRHTTWNNASCWFSEFGDGWTGWGMSMGGTPEQAIAATLGNRTTTRHGKFKTKYGRKVPLCECCGYAIGDGRYNFCPNCGAKVVEQ